MAENRKYTAHINRKGLDATGVTEDHARAMAAGLGNATMLVVEAKHAAMTTDAEGNISVTLTLSSVEPVPAHLDERVREFQRALYRNRPDQIGQAVLTGADDGETSLDDAAGALNPEVWDGDPDAPLEPAPEDRGDDGTEGDDRPWPGDEDAAEDAGGSVHTPDFSGKAKRG